MAPDPSLPGAERDQAAERTERDQHAADLVDLHTRLSEKVPLLRQMADSYQADSGSHGRERARLKGKAEGVELACSFVHDLLREVRGRPLAARPSPVSTEERERLAEALDLLRRCAPHLPHPYDGTDIKIKVNAFLLASPTAAPAEPITASRGFYRCDACGLKRLLDRDVGVCDECRTFRPPVAAPEAEERRALSMSDFGEVVDGGLDALLSPLTTDDRAEDAAETQPPESGLLAAPPTPPPVAPEDEGRSRA